MNTVKARQQIEEILKPFSRDKQLEIVGGLNCKRVCGARGHTGTCRRWYGHHLSKSKFEQPHEAYSGGVMEQWFEGA